MTAVWDGAVARATRFVGRRCRGGSAHQGARGSRHSQAPPQARAERRPHLLREGEHHLLAALVAQLGVALGALRRGG
jgi:hypothetical protein